ncbi:arylsulfotransferase family protein [Elusimicrobiota bacterium]
MNKIKIRTLEAIFIFALLFSLFFIIHKLDKDYEVEPSERIRALPYVSYAIGDKKKADIDMGAKYYDEEGAYKGFNIYNPDSFPEAYLVNMQGEVIYKWKSNIGDWQHVELCSDGGLLVIDPHDFLIRLDQHSNVLWTKPIRAHHDLDIADNEDIYVIADEFKMVVDSFQLTIIHDDCIVVLTKLGKIKEKYSLYKILKRIIPSNIAGWAPKIDYNQEKKPTRDLSGKFIPDDYTYYDVFHANSIEIIDRDIEGVCSRGDLLVSLCHLDLIGIVNIKKQKLVWHWGEGELQGPHHASLLKSGRIMVFDNGLKRKYSRVLEIDPLIKKIVWEYKADIPDKFFSSSRGGSQRLPNGNTLITESDKGHVFEITSWGDIVWEFYTHKVMDDDINHKRSALYRMTRIVADDELLRFMVQLNK